MKGCPLRCRWCHNPEGLSAALQLQFMENECIHCGLCGDRSSLEDAAHCPAKALKVCGQKISVEDLLREVLKDRIFYGEDGGVTFSGGECMTQVDFVTEMMKRLKEEGVSSVIDTSGYTSWAAFEKTLPYCHCYLYDVKMYDSRLHQENTGADNKIILENLKKLSQTGKKIWVRVPVIPGVNDSKPEMEHIAQFLSSLEHIEEVRLLPYHTLGKSKYKTLGMECTYNTDKNITKSCIHEFNEIYRKYHVKIEE